MAKKQKKSALEEELESTTVEAPSEGQSRKLTELAREYYDVEREIALLQTELEKRQKRRNDLMMRELPEYMTSIKQDRMGLEEFQVDLVKQPYYHANIAADWPEEQRERAFAYLEEQGAGDLIKAVVSYQFNREQLDDAKWLQATVATVVRFLAEAGVEVADLPVPALSLSVSWNTLTAWVREREERGNPVDREVVGATVGEIVKFKKRG